MKRDGWRLAFSDPELEREWWAWFAAERHRVLRGGFMVLLGGMVAFLPLDYALYPHVFDDLLAVRIATVALMAVAVPALFGARSAAILAERGQEWLFYVCAVVFAGLGALGATLAPTVEDERLFAPILALSVLLSGLYGATGLRVRYAAALGVGMTVIFGLVAATLPYTPEGFWIAAWTFLPAMNVLGVRMSWSLEDQARHAFLRAREIERELERADALLLNVMPRAYAERLGSGRAAVDRLADATVLFATVVGFEQATAGRHPLETVALLDRLVARFDTLAEAHGVERIKTIGATYMAAAGVSARRDDHAAAAARLAVAMREAVREVAREEDLPLALRVGIASGPLVVGVIGRTRYAFDCWGDTANTAARLDTTGLPDAIQVAAATAAALGPTVPTTPRGRIAVKGKGELETWWVP